jgi:hypothetical protein
MVKSEADEAPKPPPLPAQPSAGPAPKKELQAGKPAPAVEAPPAPSQSRRKVLLLLVLLLAVAGVLITFYGGSLLSKFTGPAAPEPPAPPVAPAVARAPAATTNVASHAAHAVSPTSAVPAVAAVRPASTNLPALTEAPPPPPPRAVSWPKLALKGVVGKGQSGSAFINSEVVGPGEQIEGVKVVAIDKGAVRLEYQGETRILKVGTAIE